MPEFCEEAENLIEDITDLAKSFRWDLDACLDDADRFINNINLTIQELNYFQERLDDIKELFVEYLESADEDEEWD